LSEPARVARATFFVLAAVFGVEVLLGMHLGWAHALSDVPRVEIARRVTAAHLPYLARPVEYPVLVGFGLLAAAAVAPGSFGVFTVTAIAGVGAAVVIAALIARVPGARPWRWVLGFPLALYAFQNWDLFALLPTVVAVVAFMRRRDRVAGFALGLGASVKLFPGVLVAPLAAARWAAGDRVGARRLVVTAAGTFALVNLPVLAASAHGWWWTYAFQSARHATWGTAWFYLYRLPGVSGIVATDPVGIANAVSLAALVAGMLWLCRVSARRQLDAAAIALAGVAIFILANKVYSPNYDLWLLPFLALLPSPRRLFVLFVAADLAIYCTVFGWFHGIVPLALLHATLPWFVTARAVVLVLLVLDATRDGRAQRLPATAAANVSSSRPMSGPVGA
jgi:uncharacterized membrane protein